MKRLPLALISLLAMLLLGGCDGNAPKQSSHKRPLPKLPSWAFGPFFKENALNPILKPLEETLFYCPIRQTKVQWEEKDVFNPAAVTKGDTVFLLYRAEDSVGKYNGTSRIGLAYSLDGLRFTRMPEPVLFPDEDDQKKYEWEGGCEDPRIVQDSLGNYVLTYTAYDGKTARLMVATSPDLRHWTKKGPAFGYGKYIDLWSKSGAIVCRREGNTLVGARIQGKYWMYWGDTSMFMATSDDMVHWTPMESKPGTLKEVLTPRKNYFDSQLVEPGPPPLLTKKGIVLLYNGKNDAVNGDTTLAKGAYCMGEALFNPEDPSMLSDRGLDPVLYPSESYEVNGQVNEVCFVQGFTFFANKAFLYYGTADSRIAVATWM